MLFPSGLVWGQEWGLLNSKNMSIVQDLRASWLDDTDDVKFGVPGLTQFAPLLPENYSQLNRLQAFLERFTRPSLAKVFCIAQGNCLGRTEL
jgi:hypothetical protein